MRLIDADAIAYELWSTTFLKNNGYHYAQNRFMVDRRDIESMPTVNQWIPCSERFPNKDGKYIVFGYWEGKEDITLCKFRTDLGRFEASWSFDIKAWMELPEPYRGDNK